MKAIKVTEPGKLILDEVEKPTALNPQEVRIQVKRMGICGSDLHILHGENPFAKYPRIIGHEVAGEVIEVGEGVQTVSTGDKVVVEPMRSCGNCYACRQNRPNVCENVQVYGVHLEGGGQELMDLPEQNVHVLHDSLDWSEMALIEPFTIGAQAVYRGQVQEGDVVFIVGAGPIGLCSLKMAKEAGATVIISDFNENRLAFAKEWGADYTLNPTENDVEEKITEWTEGMKANVVIDAVGTPQTFEQAVNVASVAGRIVLLGFHPEPSAISQLLITKKELTICGSRLQTNRFPVVVDLFNSLSFDVKDLVTHEFQIDEVHEAFKLAEAAPDHVRKVMIKFE